MRSLLSNISGNSTNNSPFAAPELPLRNLSSVFFELATEVEVIEIISNMKSSKWTGTEGITSNILNKVAVLITEDLVISTTPLWNKVNSLIT